MNSFSFNPCNPMTICLDQNDFFVPKFWKPFSEKRPGLPKNRPPFNNGKRIRQKRPVRSLFLIFPC